MTELVIDASVALKWVVEEDGSDAAVALLGRNLAAPDLLVTETANALWRRVRRGELTAEEALRRVDELGRAPLELVASEELIGSAVRLAIELGHPVYDCLYLALAIARDCPVVTADARFAAALGGHREAGRVHLLDRGRSTLTPRSSPPSPP